MAAANLDQLAYTPKQAADVCGMSEYMVLAAIRSGNLRTIHPEINGRKRRKYLILRDDLLTWLKGDLS